MTSRTGPEAGFTLVEVLAATVILAIGTMLLQGGLLRSAHLYGRYSASLKASLWADDKLWDVREAIVFTDPPNPESASGRFNVDGREFGWDLDVRSLGENIYKAGLAVRWNEGNAPAELNREIYVSHPKRADEQ
jgi:prepilin-type N-terminal cleavage/methylation domain-containing protein